MTKINTEWHDAHRMPKNATFKKRVAWHIEHQKACHCRPIPARILEEIEKK